MCNDNLVLCVSRQGKLIKDNIWNLVICADEIIDLHINYGGTNVFPSSTIDLQKEIDKIYPLVEKDTIDFNINHERSLYLL